MINLRRSNVAGEYRGNRQGASITLRVDVGFEVSLDIISGDFAVETAPGEFDPDHSFQTTTLVLEDRPNEQILRGPVKIHRDDILRIARLDLNIPDDNSELLATYTFFSRPGVIAATFTFPLVKTSNFFRRVELEVDQVKGVPLPEPFQTNTHPDTPTSVPSQMMTFQSAYREAGVDLAVTLGGEDVPVNAAGFDGLWTDEELHAAMVNHFSQHQDVEQWRLYLLLATRYVEPGVLGIMFDSGDNFPRQGAAVFVDHPAISGVSGAERDREYLYTIVHELGHAFNLLHSFQKGIFQTHGILPRPQALSWMNYPQLFPFGEARPIGWDGSTSFWPQFGFSFDRDELAHVRHNDSQEVIMGGHEFGFAGHLEERAFERPSAARDLSLTLWLASPVEFMQQVEGDIRLRNESTEPVDVHPSLHPAGGSVDLLIRRPADRYPQVYRHFAQACVRADLQTLPPGEAIYQELSPSFGLRHWYFADPGTYEVQAIYYAPDGRKLVSNIQRVRVLLPGVEADRLASDFFVTETGVYLGIEGSRIDPMRPTYEVLEEVCQRMPESAVARQVTTINALRDTRVFKDVRAGKIALPPDRTKATNQLLKVLRVTKSKKSVMVDPTQSHLRVSRYLETAAQSYMAEDDRDNARTVIATVENFLSSVKAPKQTAAALKSFTKQLQL